MDIHIQIPDYLRPLAEATVPVVETIVDSLGTVATGFQDSLSFVKDTLNQLWELPSNAYLPILAVILFFWPLVLSLVVAFATASTWIFWLFTSVVFGLVQLMYVTYQFIMISCDIMGLSTLKTYSMVRTTLLNMVDKTSGTTLGKSRRRLWRERMEKAGTYENFLKIRIGPKDVSKLKSLPSADDATGAPEQDSALPPILKASRSVSPQPDKQAGHSANIPRSSSFSNEAPPSPTRMPRSSSFGGELKPTLTPVSPSHDMNVDPVVIQELGQKTADLLARTMERLNEVRVQAERSNSDEAIQSLKYLVAAVVKRNHLQLDNLVLENARGVASSGHYGLTVKSRNLIRSYYAEVAKCIDWLSDSPATTEPKTGAVEDEEDWIRPNQELLDRIKLVRKMKQNMGRTALMLSGGGAQAMYHLGVIRALIQSKLYDDIKVVSGTSGGSIIAAMCAIKTSDELFTDVCVPTVSTDFGFNGEQRKKGIRWFPTAMEMASYWLKHKLLMDSKEFRQTCEFYYGDLTFEEAYDRNGKHVCITVSASRASGNMAQRLLLNHISTPHVTLASAVAASCALPGVMAPAKLMTKNGSGVLEPFEVDGVEWIDGSVQADLPFQRISTLFAVTTFIVSQTNFHIVPFLNKAHHPNQKSLYWRLFQTMEWDIRSRALKLSRLGLFPRIFGQDISKVFKQKYYGDLTIVPRFTTMQTFGLKALSNPTVKDMNGYLKYGQIATWPYLNAIRDMIRLEKALDDSLARLEDRLRTLHPEGDWSFHDDVDSIASSANILSASSSRVRIVGPPPAGFSSSFRETERVRRKMDSLVEENKGLKDQLSDFVKGDFAQVGSIISENEELKKQLQELQRLLGQNDSASENESVKENSGKDNLNEGSVWQLMLRGRR